MTTAADARPSGRALEALASGLRRLTGLAPALFLGAVGAVSVVGGTWWLLLAAIGGAVGGLWVLAQPLTGVLGLLVLGPELTPWVRLSLPAGIPDLTVPRMAVGLVVASMLMTFHLGLRTLRAATDVEKAMLGFSAVILLDMFARGGNPGSAALVLFDEFLAPFLLFVAARNLVCGPAELRKFCYAMVVAGLLVSAHGTYQYAVHGGATSPVALEAGATGHVEGGRAAGPFDNSTEYGGFLGCSFFWALLLASSSPAGAARFALSAATAFIGLGAVLSLTRAVWLGLLMGVFVVAWLEPRWRPRIGGALGLGAIAVGLMLLMAAPGADRLEERTASKEPIYMRVVGYRAALEMCAERPIFGYGRSGGESNFVRTRQDFLKPVFGIPAYWGNMLGPPHNTFLSTLLAWGIIGLSFFVAIYFFLLRRAIRVARWLPVRAPARRLATTVLASSAVFLTLSMFADSGAFLFLSMAYFSGAGAAFAGFDRVGRNAREGERDMPQVTVVE